MTAATKDIKTPRQEGYTARYPVKAATKIYTDTMVCLDATGYAIPAADVAGLKFVGVAQFGIDNSLGADGAEYVQVRKTGEYDFESSGAALAVTDIGENLYVADDKTVTLASVNSILAGKLSEITATKLDARTNILPATGAVS